MQTKKDPGSPVTRVNKLLKKAGHGLRLVRGRGYYYLISTDDRNMAQGIRATSIYVYWLERTERDFLFARAAVNDLIRGEYTTI